MAEIDQQVQSHMHSLIVEWLDSDFIKENDVFVVGCSTSEVAGEQIGSSGSEAIAAHILTALRRLQEEGIHLAFQCCEHLNRSLVVERETMKQYNLEEVSAIPSPEAGGSMASFAYKNFQDPVLVESLQANAGIDIGDTMIGMHLKHVAVPLRFEQQMIGHARVTGARTRPKLIGGARAQYQQ